MEQILVSANVSNNRSIHIATLARQTIIDAGVEHLGFSGYFLFESSDEAITSGINILGKVTDIEAAFKMIELWNLKQAS